MKTYKQTITFTKGCLKGITLTDTIKNVSKIPFDLVGKEIKDIGNSTYLINSIVEIN